LAALPFAHTISPTSNSKDDLLIVHANPQDVNQIIFPTEAEQRERYGRIRQSDEELGQLVAGVEAAVLAFGHLHIPGSRTWNELLLVNVSSASLPGDGDARAKYAVFTWEAGRWAIQHHRLPYPMAAEVEAYRQAQPPGWEVTVQTIEEHGFLPQTV
jgi:hypothetical protein